MKEDDEFKEIERYRKAWDVEKQRADKAQMRLNTTAAALNNATGKTEVYKEMIKLLLQELRSVSNDY